MQDTTIYLSPGGQETSWGNGPATRIVIGTAEGVATLARETVDGPWALVARSLADRHVGQLLYEPVSGKLFAGCHFDGGMWVSDDGEGKDWRQLTRGLDRPHFYALSARHSGDRVTLFAGTSPAALYRSDDLGESWREITSIRDVPDTDKWTFPPPPHLAHVKQIVFHPTEPETLYVLVEQGAFLKSVDDGKTWADITSYSHADDANYRDPHRMVLRPPSSESRAAGAPDRLYLASGVGVYRTDDGGETFERLTRRGERMGYPDFVFVDPDDPDTVYTGGSPLNPPDWFKNGVARSCVMKSADEGRTWRIMDRGMPDPMVGAFQAMAQYRWDGGMSFVVGTAIGEVYLSDDRCESWQRIAEKVGPIAKDNHHFPWLPKEARPAHLVQMHG